MPEHTDLFSGRKGLSIMIDTTILTSQAFFQQSQAEQREKGSSPAKSEQVYQYVKNQIMHNQLKPGQKILEDEIASILQTSRTPVREALRKLSNEGLVTIYPKRHTDVTYFTPEMASSLGVIRMSQDILSGHLAIYYGSDAEFARLRNLADICERYHQSNDLYGRISADRDFHLYVTSIGKNYLLMKYQEEVYSRLHLLQLQVAFHDSSEPTKRQSHHQNIIEALMNRDDAAYVQTVVNRCQEMYGLDSKVVDLFMK